MSASNHKQSLRQEARSRLQTLSLLAQSSASQAACNLFLKQSTFLSSQSVLLYYPLGNELDIRPILESAVALNKSVALPRYIPENGHYGAFLISAEPLAPGPFAILEPAATHPVPLNRLDLIVVPGLAFDLRGRRLGRGKGFYDRLLSEASGVKVGICFDEQILPQIPTEPHDVAVDFLATPSRWIDCRGPTPQMQ